MSREKPYNIEQRGNSYRITKEVAGQRYRISFDHRPTENEILLALSQKIGVEPENISNIRETFGQIAKTYIENKRNCARPISPSTEREYKRLLDNAIPDSLKKLPLSKIRQKDIQQAVDTYAKDHKPKSTRNFYGFICSVLKDNGIHFNITTPDIEREEKYLPSPDEVRAILQAVQNTKYSIPYRLACLGLRRGELIAISGDDIEIINDDIAILHITKSKVKDTNKKWITKSPKTKESKRDIVIPVDLANDIVNQGYAFSGDPSFLNEHLHDLQDRLHIHRFPLHQLRHYFASELHQKGVADVDIKKMGGWAKSSSVMDIIYKQSRIDEDTERQKDIVNKLFSDLT